METITADEIEFDFLSTELEIGCSMLERAKNEAVSKVDCEHSLSAARAALSTIRRREGHIDDARVWRDIHRRAKELQTALAAFTACAPKLSPGTFHDVSGCADRRADPPIRFHTPAT